MSKVQIIEKNGYTLTISAYSANPSVTITSAENFQKNKYKIELLPEKQDDGSYDVLITVAIVGMIADIEVIKNAQARMVEVIEVHELFEAKLNDIFKRK